MEHSAPERPLLAMRRWCIFLAVIFPLVALADDWAGNDPMAAAVRPRDGAAVEQTPPDFGWPELARDAKYELTLTFPGGRKKTLPAPQNFLNWPEQLPPGTYTWQVKAVNSRGTVQGDERRFTIGEASKPFVVPDMAKL